MSQSTSAKWKQLFRMENTEREYQFDINGTLYGSEAEVSHSVESELYEDFSIGNATTSMLRLSLYADVIPRGATIKRFIRLRNCEEVSEWLPKGVFFTNKRTYEDGMWTIEAYDVMRKAEAIWDPDPILKFPMSMPDVAKLFAQYMSAEIDPRTKLNSAYTVQKPDYGISIRQVFQYIAAAHGGNWIVTDEGKLLLVPLLSIPPETNYLIEERGDAVTFGGVRILVG